jgi:hypothetical protein
VKKLSPIGALLMGAACVANAQSPAGTPIVFSNILDNSVFVGKTCTNYNQAFFNAVTGDIIRCTNVNSFSVSINGIWTTVSGGGGGGSAIWGGISGTLSNQGDLQSALNLKQNALTFPLAISAGGNGTTTPAIVAGANVSVSGTWPNYTISASGGGGGGSVAWGSITGTLSSQGDLQTALNAKQNTLTLPLSIANGGTGTATPVISAGANVSITGTWPNYTIAATGGGGGGGIASGSALPATCTPGTDTLFFKTNGTPGQMVYTCSAINTWTLNELLGGSGALAINGTTGALDIVTSVVPRVAAANAFTGRNSFTISDYVQQATPAAPAAGKLSLYANNDGSLHFINSAGTDAALATGAGFANPMTTQDDVIVAGAGGTPARLAKGADSQVLGVDPSTHHLAYLTQSGGGGGSTPGGNSGDVQYNSAGAFTGMPLRLFVSGGTGNKMLYSPTIGGGSATLPAGETEPRSMFAMEGNTVGQPMFSINNWVSTGYSQMYFYASAAAENGNVTHRYQFGVGNDAETGLGIANKMFIYDGGPCTGTDSTCTGGHGLLQVINANPTTPVHWFNGTVQVAAQATDPVCTATGDIGKQWMDNTSATTTHFKVCAAVASTPTWVTIF